MVTEVRRPVGIEREVDFQAAIGKALVDVGDQFGLYDAMAEATPVGAAELAQSTSLPWRSVRVWLGAQAGSDYLDYDEATGRYSLWCRWPRDYTRPAHTGDAVRHFPA